MKTYDALKSPTWTYHAQNREAKFKRALRIHFLTHFLKKTFVAISDWKSNVAQIWSTHQSKALIFYFDMKKILSRIFKNFVGNRQTKFHVLKFRVCVSTHYIWTRYIHFVNFPQNFQKIESKFFSWVYRMHFVFNLWCEKTEKVFCKMSQKM